MSAMRWPPQLGQKPRRLHEKGTRRSKPQSSQCRRKKPWARMPQRRKAWNSCSTKRGTGRSSSLRSRQEGLEFLLDDVVEDALFGSMSRVGAPCTAALRVRRLRSVDRLGDFPKDHPYEPLPGACRPAGTSNARECAARGVRGHTFTLKWFRGFTRRAVSLLDFRCPADVFDETFALTSRVQDQSVPIRLTAYGLHPPVRCSQVTGIESHQ